MSPTQSPSGAWSSAGTAVEESCGQRGEPAEAVEVADGAGALGQEDVGRRAVALGLDLEGEVGGRAVADGDVDAGLLGELLEDRLDEGELAAGVDRELVAVAAAAGRGGEGERDAARPEARRAGPAHRRRKLATPAVACKDHLMPDEHRPAVVLFLPAHDEEAAVAGVVAPGARHGRRPPGALRRRSTTARPTPPPRSPRPPAPRSSRLGANRGLGAAVRAGLADGVARGAAAVAFCDADGEYAPEELDRLVGPILAGEADYVVGSRFAGGRRRHAAAPLGRQPGPDVVGGRHRPAPLRRRRR